MRRFAAAALLAGAAFVALTRPAPLAAQDPPVVLPEDRIMAVVGDKILLLSEWRDQTLVLAQQLGVGPGTPEFRELAVQSFQQLLDDLVVVVAAERDTSVKLSEEEVLEAVDQDIAAIRGRFPSEVEFQRQLAASQWGSLSAYRADLQDRKRRELLSQMFIELHRAEIQPELVTDAEVRQVWDQSGGQLGARPTLLRFEEIALSVTPGEAARDSARTEAQRIKDEILAGTLDFGEAARRHSADEGNRDEGGDLGWFDRGRMVAPFEEAAFGAVPGEVVGPVETAFGMHLIQVIDRRAEEIRARHVLIAYGFTEDDRERTRVEANRLQALVAAGVSVDSLQAAVMPGDSAAAEILELPADRLPDAYAQALETLAEGQATVVETPTGFSVVVGRGRAGGEPLTFEEVAPRIRQQLASQKAEAAFIGRLRDQIHVEVRVDPEEVVGATG